MIIKPVNPALTTGSIRSWLYIILAIAAALRLNGLTGFSLSNDELSALARLQYDSVFEVIRNGVYPDYHPAGVQLFLYYWTHLFGFSEWAIRIPFAVMGVGSVYLLFRTGYHWFGPTTGLLAAAALATLEYPLLYSQIARPYSPGLFFSLLAALFWTRALHVKTGESSGFPNRWMYFIGFSLAVSACMYIHYFSFIFAGILCFAGLFFLNRKTIVPYFVSGVIIVILYLPHMEIFMHQLSKGGVGGAEGWLGPPGDDALSKYIRYCFNNSGQLKTLYFVIAAGTFLLYRKELKPTRFHILALFFFAIPFAVAYYYSIYKNPVFQHSVLLFSFPYLLLLLFSFVPRHAIGLTSRILLFAVLAGGLYSTLGERKYYQTAHFSEFRGIASRIKQLDDAFGADRITRTISVFDPYYITYYLDKLDYRTVFGLTSIMTTDEHRQFRKLVNESKTPYFMHAYSNVFDDPLIDMVIRSEYPWVLLRDSMLGSGLRFYSRERSDTAVNRLPAQVIANGFEKGAWLIETSFLDSLVFFKGNQSIRLNPENEFGPGIAAGITKLGISPGDRLELNAMFRSEKLQPGAKLVVSVEEHSKSKFWVAAELNDFETEQGTWYRVYLPVQLPPGLNGNEELKVYCWNEKKALVWMDDFRMSVYSGR